MNGYSTEACGIDGCVDFGYSETSMFLAKEHLITHKRIYHKVPIIEKSNSKVIGNIKGYKIVPLYLFGSDKAQAELAVCNKCGAVIYDRKLHDKFHKNKPVVRFTNSKE